MRIFYDTEFLERGLAEPIRLVSIGMVREDGEELYRVAELDSGVLSILRNDPWLGPNVYMHLPRVADAPYTALPAWAEDSGLVPTPFDYDHPDVASLTEIARNVSAFCKEGLAEGEKAELWAYYADYDHVVLSQLFGRMIDLPPHMPMFTRDLKQEMDRLEAIHGKLDWPTQAKDEHHALADARWVRDAERMAAAVRRLSE